jgi:hypothetical protein
MTTEQIEKFMKPSFLNKSQIRITFKKRPPITGIFIKTPDFSELKAKNFWRIVSESKIEEFVKSKQDELARIFSGAEMTKLEVV